MIVKFIASLQSYKYSNYTFKIIGEEFENEASRHTETIKSSGRLQ